MTAALYTPTVRDWIVLIALEVQCAIFLLLPLFWLPLTDWLMRRRLRKEQEYRWRLRQQRRRRYEPVGKSRWHGRN